MDFGHEHKYHHAAHFDAELCGEPGNFSVRITGTDNDAGTPDYKAAYVPIRLGGPFKDGSEAQAALETFLIGIYHKDVTKEHTYRCGWCGGESPPVPNMKRVK